MPTTVITANARRVGHPSPLRSQTYLQASKPSQPTLNKATLLSCAIRNIKTGFFPRSPANRHEPWFAIYQARRHRRLLTWRGWLVGVVRLPVTSSRCPSKAWQSNANCLSLPIYCLESQFTLFEHFSFLHKPQEPYSENFQRT